MRYFSVLVLMVALAGCMRVPVYRSPPVPYAMTVDPAMQSVYIDEALFLNGDDVDSDFDGIEDVSDPTPDGLHCPD